MQIRLWWAVAVLPRPSFRSCSCCKRFGAQLVASSAFCGPESRSARLPTKGSSPSELELLFSGFRQPPRWPCAVPQRRFRLRRPVVNVNLLRRAPGPQLARTCWRGAPRALRAPTENRPLPPSTRRQDCLPPPQPPALRVGKLLQVPGAAHRSGNSCALLSTPFAIALLPTHWAGRCVPSAPLGPKRLRRWPASCCLPAAVLRAANGNTPAHPLAPPAPGAPALRQHLPAAS